MNQANLKKMVNNKPNLDFLSENLEVDWISFNLEGLTGEANLKRIVDDLSSHFTPLVVMGDKLRIGYSGLRNKYHVSLRECTKKNWVGTQVIFSGKNASYFYQLIQTPKLDWDIFKFSQCNLSLGRIDLCFSRTNTSNETSRSFDGFLVDSRRQIQNHTTTRYLKLENFADGKMLKVNRRNNSLHYRVYQKNESVRFELELKHRQTKLVQDYLFHNQ